VAIDPAALTSANLTKQKAELAKRRAGLQATAKNRAHVNSLLQGAIKKGYNPQLIAKLRARLQTATSQTAAQQKQYGAYSASTYQPFEKSYTQLTKLGNSNPTLESVLGKLTPFDPQAAGERLQAQSGLNQALISNKQSRDELEGDYSTASRELGEAQPERFRALLGNFAGRGMAQSSGYGSAYGNEAADFARRQTDLDTQRQRGTAQLGLADAGAQSDYLSQLAGILSGTTGRLAGNAGQLGMAGNTDLPLLLELAKRRLAAGGS